MKKLKKIPAQKPTYEVSVSWPCGSTTATSYKTRDDARKGKRDFISENKTSGHINISMYKITYVKSENLGDSLFGKLYTEAN